MGSQEKTTAAVSVAPKTDHDHDHESDTKDIILPASGVIRSLVVSEKSAHAESRGVYTFLVNPTATKIEIGSAIQHIAKGVRPVGVRVMHREGKRKRTGRVSAKRIDVKRAIVTMPKGVTLSLHEGV